MRARKNFKSAVGAAAARSDAAVQVWGAVEKKTNRLIYISTTRSIVRGLLGGQRTISIKRIAALW